MKFYLGTENATGLAYSTKDEFLAVLEEIIDGCIENDGSEFSVEVHTSFD